MRFRAFLSYSHADATWARWLLRRLETYRVPSRLVGTRGAFGEIPPRLGTFFRDRDELPSSGDLGSTIRGALDDSEALIVVCSPAAARSRWVNAEIEAFRGGGRGARVFAFVVAGEPGGGDAAQQCFPPALLADADGRPLEPLAADARPDGDGRERAFLKLVAGLLGVGYDQLARREAQRRQRKWATVAAASLVGMALALGLAVTAWVARNDAQRRQAQAEDILGFMLGDLRQKLTTVGRLDLMRAVDDKATAYFATLDPRDLSDRSLEEQARSLTGIGQVRLEEGNHAEALAAFREAHARSTALYQRAPENGQRLFDLAQAEYWIGLVAYEQGRYDETATWFGKYRDSGVRLARMDPANFDWQKELAYGDQNLATLAEKQGRYAEAERSLREVRALYRRWMVQRPRDLELRYEDANNASWLGNIAGHQGRLAEAASLFTEQVQAIEGNVAAEPDNSRWRAKLMEALSRQAEAHALLGELAKAREAATKAAALAGELAHNDPSNTEWQVSLGVRRWWQAALTPDRSAKATAKAAADILAAAHAAEPKDERALRWLAKTHNLQGQLALAGGDAATARRHLAEGLALLEPAWKANPHEELRLVLANNRLLAGEAAQAAGDSDQAGRDWRQAEQLLAPPVGDALPFERLDPLVRTLQHLERAPEAQPHLQRLAAAGYAPLRPFPASTRFAAQ